MGRHAANAEVRRTLIIQGYTPKQLEYGTGGPKQLEISILEHCSRKRSLIP